MQSKAPSLFASLLFVSCVAACSDSASDTAGDGGGGDASATADGGASDSATVADSGAEASATYVEPTCALRDDTGGPGQYSDSCVQRSWIAPYAGTYTSAKCELTITTTGSVAAIFTVKVSGDPLAGTYTTEWNGGTGVGNDSYYRFTTDATFTTTKTINFNASAPTAAGEDSISLRIVDIDKGTPSFTGTFGRVGGTPAGDVDCGAYTKK